MVSLRSVEEQLQRIGCNYKAWGRGEIRELPNVLMPDEIIAQCVNGTYEGGFALLCVTQYRVLLVDRKPMLLTIEDIRYDMIAEVDHQKRLLNSSARIFTPMRTLEFNSWSHYRLRKSVNYIQQRVMELRQHGMGMTAQQFQTSVTPQGVPVSMPQYAMQGQVQNQANPALPGGQQPYAPMNPYTKVPLLSRRRRFPSFY